MRGTQRLSRGGFVDAERVPETRLGFFGASPVRRAPPQRRERRRARGAARPVRALVARERVAQQRLRLRQGPRVACVGVVARQQRERRETPRGAKLGDAQARLGGGDGRFDAQTNVLDEVVIVVMRCDARSWRLFLSVRYVSVCRFGRVRVAETTRVFQRAEPGGDDRVALRLRGGGVFARDARTLLDERARLLCAALRARKRARSDERRARAAVRAAERGHGRTERLRVHGPRGARARTAGGDAAGLGRRPRRRRFYGSAAAARRVRSASTARTLRHAPRRARRGKRPRAVEALGERVRRPRPRDDRGDLARVLVSRSTRQKRLFPL